MANRNSKIRIYLLAIPVLVLCGVYIYMASNLNSCGGLAHTIVGLFLLFVLYIFLLVFLVYQIYKISTVPIYRFHRITASVVLIGLFLFTIRFDWKAWRLNQALLKANIDISSINNGGIILLNQSEYYAKYGSVDWSCSFTGFYEISQDTLKLEGNPWVKSEGIIANTYLISDSFLTPIASENDTSNRASTMKLEYNKLP
jgi:hypothetical protein